MSTGTDEEKTKHDEKEVAKVLQALGADFSSDVKRCKRLAGKKLDSSNTNPPSTSGSTAPSNPTPLILVKFNETSKREAVSNSAHQLRKKSEFNGIYLNADKTKAVRILEQKQREERNLRNSQFTEKDETGRPYGHHQSKNFYWAVRSGQLARVFLSA